MNTLTIENKLKEKNTTLELRSYQEIGRKALDNSDTFLLADDMGLGKTVQTIMALKNRFSEHGIQRTLIVVPNSLRSNWINELSIWFPEARVNLLDGDKENRIFYLKNSKEIIITTYEQIRTSFSTDVEIPDFDIVIYDEAQRLKNSTASTYHAAKLIISNTTWMLTGTPLENSEQDIVNLFSILRPGTIFKGFNHLEIKDGIAPFFLRRKKEECLDELPDLIEEDVLIDMTELQRREYDKLMLEKYDWYKSDNLLAFITKLKKLCNFPEEIKDSAKLKNIRNILKTKYERKEKVIIFSQYVETLKALEKALNFDFLFYDGSLSQQEKDAVVEKFQNDEEPLFLLMSLKAGGVGLNLQAANTVILFDRWWNPATEQQAIARAHRLGNKNKVHAIKFIVQDSIEEKIINILHEKEYLFEQIVEESNEKKANKNKLAELLDLNLTEEDNKISEGDING